MSWSEVLPAIAPQLILIAAACALFLIGVSSKVAARKIAAVVALLALVVAFGWLLMQTNPTNDLNKIISDPTGALRITQFSHFIKLLSAGMGAMFVLLAWPSNADGSGNSALNFGTEAAGEFYALMLLAISGIFLVADANDIILLFLGIELASIPTYIMVSISRPLPVAQEAGVKYFFLGAMSAAIMLFGFSYLYGTTGLTDLYKLTEMFAATIHGGGSMLSSWQMLAVVMLIGGFAFKMAAVPLHFYAGDVYEGAATPVTALLSFVPKASGFVALIKILFTISGGQWTAPAQIIKLLWVLAVLTMTFGNVLGLMQQNVKRVLANSSIAHSGYMLVGVTSLVGGEYEALRGVLFYLAAYGIMNVAAFGVLMLLPSRSRAQKPATSAETFEDLAGAGRNHIGLGLAMAVACFSLTGLPLTIGFFGKIFLIKPALAGHNYWLVALMMVNAAISAGYYLKIVGVMFLRPEPENAPTVAAPKATPVLLAVALSTAATILFGAIFPATDLLYTQATQAANLSDRPVQPVAVLREK